MRLRLRSRRLRRNSGYRGVVRILHYSDSKRSAFTFQLTQKTEKPQTKANYAYVCAHSRIVATFARTSSMTASGTFSSFLPLRAPKSSARGWSQRTTPVVLVPAPARDTANPAVRAKFAPLVMGRTTGTLVTWLKASGEMTKTGRRPFCSCPSAGSRPKISPRLIRSTPAGGAYTDSYACVARPSEVKSGAVAVQGRRFHREERRQRSPGLLGVVVHRRFDCQGRV